MPWSEVLLMDQRVQLIGDYQRQTFDVTELARRYGISQVNEATSGSQIQHAECSSHGQSALPRHAARFPLVQQNKAIVDGLGQNDSLTFAGAKLP